MLHKDAEIFAVGKIAESATFSGEERRKSPDRYPLTQFCAGLSGTELHIDRAVEVVADLL